MQMRKQGNEGQGTARSASKSSGNKPGEQASAGDQNTAANQQTNQGTAGAQNPSANPGTGANQGTTRNQGAGANQSTRQTQGASGQQSGDGEDLLQHAKNATGEIVHQVQERAGSQINRQKDAAASELSHVANAVRRLRDSLGGEEHGAIAQYAADYGEKAAAQIERLSHYIREQDPKQLMNDVQNFGRRQPALLLGGAFLLGFAGARLIKSAMEAGSEHQSLRRNTQSPDYTGTNVSMPRHTTAPNAR